MVDPKPAPPKPADAPAPYANRDQDPAHPANTTLSPDPNAPTTFAVVPEDMLTEQEKDVSADTPGVGPVSASEPSPGPVLTIEEQGIGPRTPYPDGDPPPTEDIVTRSQGIKKGEPREPLAKAPYPATEPKTDPFGKPI